MSDRYNTPKEGTLDWHVPLNENFDRLERDVEIRDAATNRADYTPEAGAKFFATDTYDIYVGNGNEWVFAGNPANTDGDDGGESATGGLLGALSGGQVVAVGPDTARTFDPDGGTPVQDALDALVSADAPTRGTNKGTGVVYLPPGRVVRDAGPIRLPVGAQAVKIQGFGPSTGNRPNSVLEITGNNPGFVFDTWGAKFAGIEGMTLDGRGKSEPAMRWGGDSSPRINNLSDVNFVGWGNESDGVLHWTTANNFSNHYDTLHFGGSNVGPCMKMERGDSGRLTYTQVTNMYADHDGPYPVLDIDFQAPNIDFGLLNIGGEHDQIADVELASGNAHLSFQYINYEPKRRSTNKPLFVKKGGGNLRVMHLSVNGFSGIDEIGSVYRLGGGDNFIGSWTNRGDVTLQGPPVVLTGKHYKPSWYFGPADDVNDRTSTNNDAFRVMENAGQGFA